MSLRRPKRLRRGVRSHEGVLDAPRKPSVRRLGKGCGAPVWDAYLLYGHETAWGDEPLRPISSRYTVYGAREEFEKNILPLLE
jgi:hypothetical protein